MIDYGHSLDPMHIYVRIIQHCVLIEVKRQTNFSFHDTIAKKQVHNNIFIKKKTINPIAKKY